MALISDEKSLKYILETWQIYSSVYENTREPVSLITKLQNFLSREYMMETFEITPEIHFIGNVLAHYLSYGPIHERLLTLDSVHIMQLVIIWGIPYEFVFDHLHCVTVLLDLCYTFERNWKRFQRDTLKLVTTQPCTPLQYLIDVLHVVANRQMVCQNKVKDYNRKMVFVFRAVHGYEYAEFLPVFRWGEENHWAKHLFLTKNHCINGSASTFQESGEDYIKVGRKCMYGCDCGLKEVVQYMDYVYDRQNPNLTFAMMVD